MGISYFIDMDNWNNVNRLCSSRGGASLLRGIGADDTRGELSLFVLWLFDATPMERATASTQALPDFNVDG